jgi:integrase
MAKREINRLDPLSVPRLIKAAAAGRHADGLGLYLVVDPSGAARWVFLYRRRGENRKREMGLGSAHTVTLKRARERAADARGLLSEGQDPIEAKRAVVVIPSFGEVADDVLANKEAEYRSQAAKNRAKRALEVYCEPIRSTRVDRIDTEAVLGVLKPIWSDKPETAQKARGLIEAVLNAAKAKGFRTGDNPAAWKGHLDHLLAKRQKLTKGHHPSMDREALPAFVANLRTREAVSARALEFTILTACRAGEALGARWDEMDLEANVWTIPAERMKSGKEHRVPLSARAAEIVESMKANRIGPFVFPGQNPERPMWHMSFDNLMERMGVEGVTTHGFRSTFRDWAGEVSTFPRELAEAALAHVVGDQTERAYARGDALEKRRKMMEAWATFCSLPAGGNITQLRQAQ